MSVPGYKDKIEFGVIISFAYKVLDSDEVSTSLRQKIREITANTKNLRDKKIATLIEIFISLAINKF